MLARARDTWTAIDLTTAANLARCQADIEHLQKDLTRMGYVLDDGKINPLANLIDTLTKRTLSLARALHVHAEATTGRSQDASKALANEKKAAQNEASDLIPSLGPVYLVG